MADSDKIQGDRAAQDKAAKRPAQVPGDAESPPKGSSGTAKDAIRKSDPTEPVPAGRQDR